MKKRLLALLLAGTMVVSLAACGGKGNEDQKDPSPTPTTAAQPTEGTKQPEATPEPTPTPVPVDTMKFSGPPTVSGNVTDRIPVASDVFVEQVSASGEKLEIGVYGGKLNLMGSSSSWNASRPILESIIHYNTDGTYYANVIKEFSHSDDYKVWTFKLREGMKWSDGAPFTADDIVFWYEQCHLTNFDTKKSWTALYTPDADGNPVYATLTKVNDYEVTWTFASPKYPADFIENGDFKWCWAPKHYIEDMIPQSVYAGSTLSDEQALANAQAKGLSYATVKDMGKAVAYYFWNVPGIPTLNSYVLSTKAGVNDVKGSLCIFERNAYFWKVDAEGQQLPYCDEINFIMTSAVGQEQLMFLSGELDMIEVGMQDISTMLTNANGKAYLRTFSSTNWGSYQVTFNYTCTDEKLAALFANKDFRQAMSISVDRTQVSGLLSDGFLEPGQACPGEGNFGYDADWETKWTTYDVATAKKLLEGCGLVMGSDGFYDFADGTDLVINFYAYVDSTADAAYPVLEQYWKAAGIKTAYKGDYALDAFDQEIDNNTWYAVINPHTSIGGLSLRSRVAPFVPIAQAAEWYGEYGTYYATNGANGVKPTGAMADLVTLYEQWNSTPDTEARDEIALKIYEIHKENLWTIAYLKAAGNYNLVSSAIHNWSDNLVSDDLYQYGNIVHYWTLFKK